MTSQRSGLRIAGEAVSSGPLPERTPSLQVTEYMGPSIIKQDKPLDRQRIKHQTRWSRCVSASKPRLLNQPGSAYLPSKKVFFSSCDDLVFYRESAAHGYR
ncbi:hypothetical protein F4680DRAFT_429801 [Xylaria scruposa]|nr:hypothetical protein F4680DRAFT_429801 [Xylaria scruposa]